MKVIEETIYNCEVNSRESASRLDWMLHKTIIISDSINIVRKTFAIARSLHFRA